MQDDVRTLAHKLDCRLARLALDIAGNREAALVMIDRYRLGRSSAAYERFIHEAGALLKARRHLSAAIEDDAPPFYRLRRLAGCG